MSGSRLISVLFIAVALLLVSAPMIAHGSQAAGKKIAESTLIDIRLDGPSVIGIDLNTSFTLRVSYAYPERILNYTFKAQIIGTDIAGGKLTPSNGTSNSGVFPIGITGVSQPGKMQIQVNVTAAEAGAEWFRLKEFDIDVVKPIYIDATLVNDGGVPANSVSVKMLVDGELKDTKYVNVDANGTLLLNFSWVFSTVPEGKHTITLVIDDPSKFVEFSEGNNVMKIDVYYSQSGDAMRGILVIVMIFAAFILLMTILQKKPASSKGK